MPEVTGKDCQDRWDLLQTIMQHSVPFYHLISLDPNATEAFVHTFHRFCIKVSEYLNDYTCLNHLDTNDLLQLSTATDGAAAKFFIDWSASPAAQHYSWASEKHFMYLQRELDEALHTISKSATADGDSEDGDTLHVDESFHGDPSAQLRTTASRRAEGDADRARRASKYVDLGPEGDERQEMFQNVHQLLLRLPHIDSHHHQLREDL